MTPSNDLPEHNANVHHLNLRTVLLVRRLRYCVRHDQLLQRALFQRTKRVAAEDPVSDDRKHSCSAGLREVLRGQDECAACVRHVVDEDGRLASNMPDQHHARHLVRLFPLLVEQRKVHPQPVGNRSRAGRSNQQSKEPGRLITKTF